MKTTTHRDEKQHTMKSNYGNSRRIRNMLRSTRQKEGKINTHTHTHRYDDDNDDDRVIIKVLFSDFSVTYS